MIEALIGAVTAIVAMVFREAFYKGKNQQKIDAMQKQIENLKEDRDSMDENINLLKQSNAAKEQKINSMSEDHIKIEQSITELNKNIGVNNQAIASLDATLKGVNELLKHIINGNLKIAAEA